jgi:hypothetical protein
LHNGNGGQAATEVLLEFCDDNHPEVTDSDGAELSEIMDEESHQSSVTMRSSIVHGDIGREVQKKDLVRIPPDNRVMGNCVVLLRRPVTDKGNDFNRESADGSVIQSSVSGKLDYGYDMTYRDVQVAGLCDAPSFSSDRVIDKNGESKRQTMTEEPVILNNVRNEHEYVEQPMSRGMGTIQSSITEALDVNFDNINCIDDGNTLLELPVAGDEIDLDTFHWKELLLGQVRGFPRVENSELFELDDKLTKVLFSDSPVWNDNCELTVSDLCQVLCKKKYELGRQHHVKKRKRHRGIQHKEGEI